MEEKVRALKLKKAMLVDQLMMLASVSDTFYLQLGKIEAEIILLERTILQSVKNDLE